MTMGKWFKAWGWFLATLFFARHLYKVPHLRDPFMYTVMAVIAVLVIGTVTAMILHAWQRIQEERQVQANWAARRQLYEQSLSNSEAASKPPADTTQVE
jgi:hypothetical protein